MKMSVIVGVYVGKSNKYFTKGEAYELILFNDLPKLKTEKGIAITTRELFRDAVFIPYISIHTFFKKWTCIHVLGSIQRNYTERKYMMVYFPDKDTPPEIKK